jgi:hypothetical protein
MDTPDNHFTRRAEARMSQGHTPERPAVWPVVLLAIACWCLVVCVLTLLGLPFVRWIVDHGHPVWRH